MCTLAHPAESKRPRDEHAEGVQTRLLTKRRRDTGKGRGISKQEERGRKNRKRKAIIKTNNYSRETSLISVFSPIVKISAGPDLGLGFGQ